MKKLLSFLLALALLSGLSVIAFADGESTGGNQTVNAHITGDPSWVLVIPADQTIEFMAEETDIVHHDCSIDNPKHIPADCTINASLTHTGNFTLKTDESKTIPFTLNAFDEEVAAGTPVIVSQYWSDTGRVRNRAVLTPHPSPIPLSWSVVSLSRRTAAPTAVKLLLRKEREALETNTVHPAPLQPFVCADA